MAFAIAASAISAAATASAGTVTLASTVPPVVNSSTVYAGGLTNSYCAGLNGNCVIGPPNHITTYAPQYIYEEISVPANTTITELGYYEYFTVNKAADYTSTNWVIGEHLGSFHPFSTSGTTIGTAATSGDPTLVTVSGLSVHIQYAGNYWIGVENNISSVAVPTVYGASQRHRELRGLPGNWDTIRTSPTDRCRPPSSSTPSRRPSLRPGR